MQAAISRTEDVARAEVDSNVEVSVVMPCLNEARTVGRCVEKALRALGEMGIPGEVIVADNGSVDGSPEIAEQHGARVVHVERKGYGSALQAGIAAARGRFVIMGDADDSYDFSCLEPFVAQLYCDYDLVLGNRFQGGILPGAMPWLHRYIGNPILTGILNFFFHSPIHDAHCGLRAFRKDAYEELDLRTTGMEFASEMVVKACLHRQEITEVPIVLHPDGRDRPPHLRSFRDGWRHLRFLLLLCPFWLYLVPGYLFMGIGLALMTWFGLQPRPQEVFLYSFLELLGSGCVLAGYEVLWLGAFAKAFGSDTGLFPPTRTSGRFLRWLWLERGLVVGLLLFSAGLGFDLWLGWQLSGASIGSLDLYTSLRGALWGCTIMLLGLQTIFGSFFLTMLSMRSSSESHGS
jgi:glycosyltransferase involved in cell wall biosynthesis